MMQVDRMQKFERVVERVEEGASLVEVWEMEGGVSAEVTGLEIEGRDGERRKLIVRVHGDVDYGRNAGIAEDEFRLLEIVREVGVRAPRPYYVDVSRDIFERPYVVVEYVEGKTVFALSEMEDGMRQMAMHLARIHRADYGHFEMEFLEDQGEWQTRKLEKRPERLDESIGEGKIRDVLEAGWPLKQKNKSVLLHGDFWPGNILWREGELVGIIDWEDAMVGDPLGDLGRSRLEVLWAFGYEAMVEFTEYYKGMNEIDYTNLPYWDLCAALRPAFKIAEWAGDEQKEASMRAGHRLFVEQAYQLIEGKLG